MFPLHQYSTCVCSGALIFTSSAACRMFHLQDPHRFPARRRHVLRLTLSLLECFLGELRRCQPLRARFCFSHRLRNGTMVACLERATVSKQDDVKDDLCNYSDRVPKFSRTRGTTDKGGAWTLSWVNRGCGPFSEMAVNVEGSGPSKSMIWRPKEKEMQLEKEQRKVNWRLEKELPCS